jgi:hypothetical protein
MSDEVRGAVLDLIGEERDFNLTNMLYGLFDGYLYKELDEVQNPKLQEILTIVREYPVLGEFTQY